MHDVALLPRQRHAPARRRGAAADVPIQDDRRQVRGESIEQYMRGKVQLLQ